MGRHWDSRPRAEQLVAQWLSASEDESLTAFCARHGVRMETFRRWRHRLGEACKPASAKSPALPGFVEIGSLASRGPAPDPDAAFIAEIVTPGGYTVRIRSAMPPALLREVLESC